jgi:hypothetical protein
VCYVMLGQKPLGRNVCQYFTRKGLVCNNEHKKETNFFFKSLTFVCDMSVSVILTFLGLGVIWFIKMSVICETFCSVRFLGLLYFSSYITLRLMRILIKVIFIPRI